MACEVLNHGQGGGFIDGEYQCKTDGTEYVAGQALKITTDGKLDLAANPEDVIGLAANDRRIDAAGGPQAGSAVAANMAPGSYVAGFAKVKMNAGTLVAGTTRTPFKYPGTNTWARGQRIFLGASSLWDNAQLASPDAPMGIVLKAPTADDIELEALMFTAPLGSASSAITT